MHAHAQGYWFNLTYFIVSKVCACNTNISSNLVGSWYLTGSWCIIDKVITFMLGVLVTTVVFLLMEATPILMVMGSKVGSDEVSCFHQISQGDRVHDKNIVCIYVCCSYLPLPKPTSLTTFSYVDMKRRMNMSPFESRLCI